MIVKDAMVLIHLARITLLEKSCDYFKEIFIANKVYEEVLIGREKGYSDVEIVDSLVQKGKIIVESVGDEKFLKKALMFNINGGEMESVALYWKKKADYLATDDNNVRKKSILLNITTIGTPAILLGLYKGNIIEKSKFISSVNELKKIGWFSSTVIDKLLMEAK